MNAMILLLTLLQDTPKIHDDELKCNGIWYDSTACACPKGTQKCCPCECCTGGPDCPCLNVLKKGTGSIKGTVKSPYFRRSEGVVYLREVKDRKFALPRKNPAMDQKNLVYTPHVLPIVAGSTVDFPNSDTVRHNVFADAKDSAEPFNLGTYEVGDIKRVKFEKAGVNHLGCNVHAEMSAYIVVLQNPYFSVTVLKDGSFEIRNVPAGTHKLAVFHEKMQAEEIEVTVEAGKAAQIEITKFNKK